MGNTFAMSNWITLGEFITETSFDSSTRWVTDIIDDFVARVEWGITSCHRL